MSFSFFFEKNNKRENDEKYQGFIYIFSLYPSPIKSDNSHSSLSLSFKRAHLIINIHAFNFDPMYSNAHKEDQRSSINHLTQKQRCIIVYIK